MKLKTYQKILINALLLCSLSLNSCGGENNSFDESQTLSNTNSIVSENTTTNSEDNIEHSEDYNSSFVTEFDPFEGIQLETIGTSPYCKVVVDTGNCDSLCHSGVKYSLDKTRYSNGEIATITATLQYPLDTRKHALSRTELKYEIPKQPEYILTSDGIDLKLFEESINNYIIARNAETVGNHWFWNTIVGSIVDSYKSIENGTLEKVYFISIRKNYEKDTANSYYSAYTTIVDHFNSFNFIYSFDTTTYKGNKEKVYVNIVVPNIIRDLDGSIKWGKASEADFKLVHHTSVESLDFLLSSTVLKYSEAYKITEINK